MERGTVREEHDWAIRQRDKERQVVSSLRADLGVTVTQRLEAESIFAGLGKELAEVRGILQVDSDEHNLLRATVGVVFNEKVWCNDCFKKREEVFVPLSAPE